MGRNPLGITKCDIWSGNSSGYGGVTIFPSASIRLQTKGRWELIAVKKVSQSDGKNKTMWSIMLGLNSVSKELARSGNGRNSFALKMIDLHFAQAMLREKPPTATAAFSVAAECPVLRH